MQTLYEDYTDSQLIDALVERLNMKQVEIGKRFYMSESSVSQARKGTKRLRISVRQGMIDLLIQQENEEQQAG